jgi:DNA-binding NarL/FixJ family response regulator
MTGKDATEKHRILAWSASASTRFLLSISVDPARYALEFADRPEDMLNAARGNTHEVFVIDAAREASDTPGGECFREVAALALRHMIRVVAIADKAPEEDHMKMADFGPLAVIPFNFPRSRLNRAIQATLDMQAKWQPARDTGSRVKADPKFYKVQRFTE